MTAAVRPRSFSVRKAANRAAKDNPFRTGESGNPPKWPDRGEDGYVFSLKIAAANIPASSVELSKGADLIVALQSRDNLKIYLMKRASIILTALLLVPIITSAYN